MSFPSTISTLPVLSFSISSVQPFDLTREADIPLSASRRLQAYPPSKSGLARGVTYRSLGVSLDGVFPKLSAEYGVTFAELGVRLTAVTRAGLGGLDTGLLASWAGDDKAADAEISVNSLGVQLKLGFVFLLVLPHFWDSADQDPPRFVYLSHRLELPLVLSHEANLKVAMWTTLLPTTALVLVYGFVLRPLERKRRMEYVTCSAISGRR